MKRYAFSALVVASILAGCGGGGGGSSPTPPTPVTPAPTVTVSLSSAKTTVGTPVTISWSSTNSTSCAALGAWAGIKPVSGSDTITPTAGGQFTYTVSCDGAGGTAQASTALITPIPVQKSSYLNAKNINIGPVTLPKGDGFVANEAITAGFQFGDFFQDGTIAMAASSNVFNGQNGFGATAAGRMYFFHSDGKGGWIDQTSQLLSAADRTGCISPRKVIVADFNGDGKPDVFVACHGIDGNIPSGYSVGEHPRYLLSQSDGKYKNFDAGFTCYCHGATAADFNGNGFADVIVTDPVVSHQALYLKNAGNGTFAKRTDLTPISLMNENAFSVELVDVNSDNKPDLVFLGSEKSTGGLMAQPWDFQTTIFVNSGTNTFSDASQKVLMPLDGNYPNVLDIIAKDGKVAILRIDANWSNMEIQEFSYSSMNLLSSTTHAGADGWFTLFNNMIVNLFANNSYSINF